MAFNQSFSILSNSSLQSNPNSTSRSLSINQRNTKSNRQFGNGIPPRRPLSLIASSADTKENNKRTFSTSSNFETSSSVLPSNKQRRINVKGHKRTQSEIVTRSVSNVIRFENVLKEAKESFLRMDLKTSERICNEIIQARETDTTPFLLLRSMIKEKKGEVFSAFDDAKLAQKQKRSDPECHSRLAQMHLAIALHHTDASIGLSSKPSISTSNFLFDSNANLKRLSTNRTSLTSLQTQYQPCRLLERLPLSILNSELLQMISVNDSKDLVNFSSTCSQLKQSLQSSITSALFENFNSMGRLDDLLTGLRYFMKRSGNRLKRIRIEVDEEHPPQIDEFRRLISGQIQNLEELEVIHLGALNDTLRELELEMDRNGGGKCQINNIIKTNTRVNEELQNEAEDSNLDYPFESSIIIKKKSHYETGQSFLSLGNSVDPDDSGSSLMQEQVEVQPQREEEEEEKENTSNSTEEMNRWLARHLDQLRSSGVLQSS